MSAPVVSREERRRQRDEQRQRRREQHQQGDWLATVVPAWERTEAHLQRVRDELVSLNGIVRRGALAKPIIGGASMKLSVSAGQLAGWSIRDATGGAGAPAVVRLRDGLDAGGDLIATLNIPAGGNAPPPAATGTVGFTAGLFVEVVSGLVEGVVYIGPAGL